MEKRRIRQLKRKQMLIARREKRILLKGIRLREKHANDLMAASRKRRQEKKVEEEEQIKIKQEISKQTFKLIRMEQLER
jgi:hypothetical protein